MAWRAILRERSAPPATMVVDFACSGGGGSAAALTRVWKTVTTSVSQKEPKTQLHYIKVIMYKLTLFTFANVTMYRERSKVYKVQESKKDLSTLYILNNSSYTEPTTNFTLKRTNDSYNLHIIQSMSLLNSCVKKWNEISYKLNY